jgi:hypothetical protein
MGFNKVKPIGKQIDYVFLGVYQWSYWRF